MGTVPYDTYKAVLRASTLHVYLTVPFVLSWSLLEAAYLCKQVLASDTMPLREVKLPTISRIDYFDGAQLEQAMIDKLKQPSRSRRKPEISRQKMQTCSVQASLRQHGELLEQLLGQPVGL